jgi:hypothetical protein
MMIALRYVSYSSEQTKFNFPPMKFYTASKRKTLASRKEGYKNRNNRQLLFNSQDKAELPSKQKNNPAKSLFQPSSK